MDYNLLDYSSSNASSRDPYFRTIIQEADPDILVVQEISSSQGQASVNAFLNNVLKVIGDFVAGIFIQGPDTNNAIFFKDSLFTFISNTPIDSGPANGDRDINGFKLVVKASLDTFIVYSAHLKASTGFESQRAYEVDSLRKVTDQGVEFQSHIDGLKHFFTPELVVDIQKALGSDIMMQLEQERQKQPPPRKKTSEEDDVFILY